MSKVSAAGEPVNRQNYENVELDLFGNDSDEADDAAADNAAVGSGSDAEVLKDLPSNDWSRSLHGKSFQNLRRRSQGSKVSMKDVASTLSDQNKQKTKGNLMKAAISYEETSDDPLKREKESHRQDEMIKAMPTTIAEKRGLRKVKAASLDKRAGKSISCWKQARLTLAMKWSLFRANVSESASNLELWRGHLKEVEGNFGNGVLSYFLFLKSLLFMNILIFLCVFCFIVIPQILVRFEHFTPANTTRTVNETVNGTYTMIVVPWEPPKKACQNYSAYNSTSRNAKEHITDFITGVGWINTTLMFYSQYSSSNFVSTGGDNYNMPLAYMLVCGAYMIISLLMMVNNLAHGFTETVVEGGGMFYSWCNKVFASWDYCIEQEQAIMLKCKNIYKDFEAQLAEEKRLLEMQNRTRLETFKIYVIRILINIVVMGLYAASIVAIIKTVEISLNEIENPTQNLNTFIVLMRRWGSALTISVLNIALPTIFNIITNFEKWSPRHYISVCLLRSCFLKLASVTVLIVTLYMSFTAKDRGCIDCWENMIGGQMFNLILVDFIVSASMTVIVETTRKYVNRYANCGMDLGQKIGKAEFQIPKNVLDLVYGQSLVWIGTFFAPLLPVLGILKLIFMFYVKKYSLVYNCKPSNESYRGGRTNYFFTLLLIFTFLLTNIAVGYGITKVKTSCCGPFSNTDCQEERYMISIIMDMVNSDTWPTWVGTAINYLESAVVIFPLLVILFLVLYYYRSMTHAQEKMIQMLKDQLMMEGRDKRFLMDRLIRANEEKNPIETSEARTASTGIGSGGNVKNINVMTSVQS